jgi:hypothetical protein
MTPRSPSEVLELTVALDYGEFYLVGQPVQQESPEDLILQLLDTAINGIGIASSEGNEVVVVLSPHQNNFAMGLRVELWQASRQTTLTTGRRHSAPAWSLAKVGSPTSLPPWRLRRSPCRRAGTRHGLPDEGS